MATSQSGSPADHPPCLLDACWHERLRWNQRPRQTVTRRCWYINACRGAGYWRTQHAVPDTVKLQDMEMHCTLRTSKCKLARHRHSCATATPLPFVYNAFRGNPLLCAYKRIYCFASVPSTPSESNAGVTARVTPPTGSRTQLPSSCRGPALHAREAGAHCCQRSTGGCCTVVAAGVRMLHPDPAACRSLPGTST